MKNTMKKGLILGGILTAAAAVSFAMRKARPEITEEMQNDLRRLTTHLKKNLQELEDVTQERFDAIVVSTVETHAKRMKLAEAAKKQIIVILQKTWNEMQKVPHFKKITSRA
jgi:gas vesicle protein